MYDETAAVISWYEQTPILEVIAWFRERMGADRATIAHMLKQFGKDVPGKWALRKAGLTNANMLSPLSIKKTQSVEEQLLCVHHIAWTYFMGEPIKLSNNTSVTCTF